MPLGRKLNTRKDNILVQDIDNETLVYDLNKNKAYSLSETSALVWRELDGTKSADEISRAVSKSLGKPVSEDIVWLALSQMKTEGLLEDHKSVVTPFDGLNRREVVKRVGFASMVALPVISSLIAPSGVHAQSGPAPSCGCFGPGNAQMLSDPGCTCTGSSDCCGGSCGLSGNLCIAMSVNPTGAPGCCPTVVCPPQNDTNIPPGCGCNGTTGVCASGNCIGNICSLLGN